MKTGSVLLLVGLILLPTYFVLFYSTFKKYEYDGKRYVEEFGKDRWRNIIAAGLVVAAFVVPNRIIAVGLIIAAAAWAVYETALQHGRMKELGFSEEFRHRLGRVSGLPPVAILCIFVSKLWYRGLMP